MCAEAKYTVLYREFRDAIVRGQLPFETRMPSVRQISDSRSISKNTVLAAYRRLEAGGLIYSRERSGFFVSANKDTRPKPECAIGPYTAAYSDEMFQLLSASPGPEKTQFGLAELRQSLIPSEQIRRIMRKILREDNVPFAYPPPVGSSRLIDALHGLMVSRGSVCGYENLVVTNGCHEALWLALRAVTRPGDLVACESPTYPGFYHICNSLQLNVLEIPSSAKTGIKLDILATVLKKQAVRAVYYAPNASNPAGATMPADHLEEIVNLAQRHDLVLIEDDTNHDLVYKEGRPRSGLSLTGSGRIIYCGSFSKTLAASLRVGWLSAPEPYLTSIKRLKYDLNLGGNALAQLVCAEMLEGRRYARHVLATTPIHEENMNSMLAVLARGSGNLVKIHKPTGGFLLWVHLPPGVDSTTLCQLAAKQGIALGDGNMFGQNPSFRQRLRIGWGGRWSALVEKKLRLVGRLIGGMA